MKELSLDYRYLKAFIVTAKYLNFSRAAQELSIAQSAVSRQIKLLEESVGDQLIIRSPKKVILTEKGLSLIKELTHFEGKIRDIFFAESSKHIRIGILHGLLENWFNDIIVEFSKHSKHQISIEVNTLDRLKQKLQDGLYDFIFTTENIQSDLISSLKLFDERMILISGKEIDPRQAWDYPWIVYSEQDHLFQIFKKHSQKIIVVNSVTSIQKLVRKNVGVAIVPDHTLEEGHHLKVYDLKNLPKQHIFLSGLNFKELPPHLKELMLLIKKNC